MIKIISIVLQLAAVVGGATLGLWLKSSQSGGAVEHIAEPEGAEHETAASKKDAAAQDDHGGQNEPANKKKKKKKSDGHGGGSRSDVGYLKFGRQFIVPVVKQGEVSALVVLDINLEVDPSVAETAYAREPKLRDTLLTTLLQLSNAGAFNDQIIQEENIESIRAALFEAAATDLGEDVKQVLIQSIAKQDL